MPNDDTTDSTDQQPQGTPVDDQPKPNGQSEQKPEGADDLAAWKGHARKHEDRAKALAAENDDLKKQLEAANTAAGRVADLEASLAAAEQRAERAELAADVATSKGVKLRYLAGNTREELEASADEVLADFQAMPRTGVVPTQGTGSAAPRTSSYAAGAERARAQSTTHTKKEEA